MSQTKAQLIDPVDGTIVNADINASAAIDGSKISPSFTSNITILNTHPKLFLTDTNNNDDFSIENVNGTFKVLDQTDSVDRFTINSVGRAFIHENGTGNGMGGFVASTASDGGNAGFGFMTGGTQRFNITTIGSADSESLRFYDNNNSAERLRLDQDGRLLLGTTTEGYSTADDFTIAGSGDCGMTIRSGTSSQSAIAFSDATSGNAEFAGQISYYHSTDELVLSANTSQIVKIHDEHFNIFAAEGTLRMNFGFQNGLGGELSIYDASGSQKTRITGSANTNHFFNNGGNVGIGLNNPNKPLHIFRASVDAEIRLQTNSGTENNAYLTLRESDGDFDIYSVTSGSKIRFHAVNAETLTLGRSGSHAEALLNTTTVLATSVLSIHTNGSCGIGLKAGASNNQKHIAFANTNGEVGSITTNGTATSFNTSSDYRLKENAVAISDGITRLKTLIPYRFNFKADASTKVDGFFAHEVTAVPEAITGEKDATENCSNVVLDKDGNFLQENVTQEQWNAGKAEDPAIYPSDSTWSASYTKNVYQGIDQSKLVPLLVAAVKELITKVESLEAA